MASGNNVINNGIQANTVEARAIAVGQNATAVVNETNTTPTSDEMNRMFSVIRSTIEELKLNLETEKNLKDDVENIRRIALDKQADKSGLRSIVQNFREKIELIGGVLSGTAAVAEPVGRLVKLLMSLPF